MEALAGLMTKAPDYVLAISGIIASLTVLTALTPTKLDDKCLGVLTKYVNMLLKLCNIGAGNIFANKNKDDKGKY
mgnify:CR=1 FL=1